MKNQRKIISRIFNILVICLLIIFVTIYFISVYINENFPDATFEQLYYTLSNVREFMNYLYKSC